MYSFLIFLGAGGKEEGEVNIYILALARSPLT